MDYQKTYTYPSNLSQNPVENPSPPAFSPQPMPQYTPPTPYPTQPVQPTPLPQPMPPVNFQEQSYIENILRLNKGKVGTFYFTYTDSNEWRDRVYKGVIEAAGRDHLIISDPKTGKRYLFQMIYFDWAEFDEEIAYQYPYR